MERLHEPTGARNPATWEPVLELVLVVRHVEVFQLGTPYTRLVGRIARLLREPRTLEGYELRAGHLLRPHQTLVMDATGVGDPVVELFQAERLPARLHPVFDHLRPAARTTIGSWRSPWPCGRRRAAWRGGWPDDAPGPSPA